MTLLFPHQPEPLTGPTPASLAAGSTSRYRPFAPVTIFGLIGQRSFTHAVFDTGADDTIFPLSTGARIGAQILPDTGHRIRWRGTLHPLRFAQLELELDDGNVACRWPAIVAFTPAPLRYPLLGVAGCLEYFDTTFRGVARLVELTTNQSYPGIAP